jgi:hypothetical protein
MDGERMGQIRVSSPTSLLPERAAPTPEEFRSVILPSARPLVLRGAASHWPLVVAAREGAGRCAALLSQSENGLPVDILRADPDEEGRFHYAADGHSLNFIRGCAPLPVFLAALREQAIAARPFALVVQGLPAKRHMPGFTASHPLPLVPAEAEPRLWIGNAAKVATHNDPVENIAAVVAGRRRFTIFPPEAEGDLYMGPNRPTPAGTPVSMVHVTAPDLERYPRFAEAMKVAQVAELLPGDAIFIPRDWFHHVEALESFNLLVNYWWDASTATDWPQDSQ